MTARTAAIFGVVVALTSVEAASISKQQADLFSRKVAQIVVQGDAVQKPGAKVEKPGTKKTQVSETELNSWFAYSAKPLLPSGVTEPRITLVGSGKVAGQAIVDLDAIAKKKQTGGTFDVWNLVGGKVPVNVAGTLRTKDGVGTFLVESADVSGLPLPKSFLQEVVSYYSRTPTHPQGLKIDDPFELPASIQQIDVGSGQAVIVQ
jgi:hypothetical protein